MSFLNLAFPAETAIPFSQALIGMLAAYVRPALGLGALVTVLMVFKPLLLGLAQAAVLLVKPRKSLEQRILAHKFSGKRMLNRMANEYSLTQPNFANELRNMAARD
ncbi:MULTISPECIES: hypothetical protein [unclassified Herbaspirillum]|uniref:hypothetical protein n=1 Tax=unclassified Herbaspirillum TaxID=2624150 RepID=UPI00114FEB49|nr:MULTISPECIES: hypothetical protein [unclassified Herbaspirillum]MBB5393931.1 hypothetical protein [Herbaspirillum sp. SJZ102]TQK00032.1 hypothetical protein FB599_3994 [Herbaspirillum sp. SJZ130]TQK04644.1 hypothetical protein FB598_3966 [Herbaspirillum sp. SJZ106]TWC63239.1 hypothetical protein FB597_11185 [Herbaspirillum sp. SJZ099]